MPGKTKAKKQPKIKVCKKKKSTTEITAPLCELKESIEQLEDRIDKTNSIRRVFWKGVLTGLGGAIGATIIFAILISIISWIINETQATWLQAIIEAFGIDIAVGK
jgi:hypothetical protein